MEKKKEINHFTDLEVWKKSHELVLMVYSETREYPKEEIFGLTSQIRRSASSIAANIAEGYGRFHFKDKLRFYLIARGSLTETQNHLITSRDLGYLNNNDYNKADKLCLECYRLLNGIIRSTGNLIDRK